MSAVRAAAPTTVPFWLNGQPVEVATFGARRLIDVLRVDFGLTGPKEGCGEGECGACSVLLDGDVVVSCLLPVAQVAGRSVVTVEGLEAMAAPADGADAIALDPLQRAFHETGAVQCGMCTPGMLLAARAYLDRGGGPDPDAIREAIAGNLCRCTGYVKVVDAIMRAALDPALEGDGHGPAIDLHAPARSEVRRVHGSEDGETVFRPRTIDEALDLLATDGRRAIVGATDVMVELARSRPDDVPALVDLGLIGDLHGIDLAHGELIIGAATTYAELRRSPLVGDVLPVLGDVAAQVGAAQIQNRGTVGGNIVTASPAGDLLPLLLAIEASFDVVGRNGGRTIPASAFWTGYRETAIDSGEILTKVRIPVIPGREVRFRKVGTRRAQAIAKVSLAIAWRPVGDAWRGVRIGLGSVAERPIRALGAEAALEGSVPNAAIAALAAAAVERDCRPIDDIRSTAAYRRAVTGRILRRFVLDAAAARA